MKLSIDDLRVDSYAIQLSEQELTEVKGGTTIPCGLYVLAGAIVTAGAAVWAAYASQPKSSTTTVQTIQTNPATGKKDTTTVTTTVVYR